MWVFWKPYHKLWLVTLLLIFILNVGVEAQKSKSQKPAKKPVQKSVVKKPVQKIPAEKVPPVASDANHAEDDQKVKDIVAFLGYVLNTIGSSSTAARDKDVLITESYSKIFRDSKVQIEDDLDEERRVITNKDVVAYLKDVDFFFQDVKFDFTIEDIKSSTMSNGQLFYKVSLRRTLTGTTAEGKTLNNSMARYIEINYNPEDKDLKIVSIYTNEFNEKKALTNWWKELSFEWKGIFKEKLKLADSVTLNDIKNITSIEELDLSSNRYIQTIEPLGQLINLKLLDLSATNVTDLTPIRNLTELMELNLSNTKIQDLTPLKYATKIVRLNLDHTEIKDIFVLEKMTALQNLGLIGTKVIDFSPLSYLTGALHINLQSTKISDLSPIAGLVQMVELNVSQTLVQNLDPIIGFNKLIELDIDSISVSNLTPLSDLKSLKILHANYTVISDLQPLQKLSDLEKVYCDQTNITREKADAFMLTNKNVLVVFDSRDLQVWWENISPSWKDVLRKAAKIGTVPSREELARVTNTDSINFSDNRMITDLEPLKKLPKLRVIIANRTGVNNLLPLKDHREITILDVSETGIDDLSTLSQFKKLTELRADKTKIQSIESLYGLKSLKKLYVDHTNVHDITAREFLEQNSSCLLVYKTSHLDRWWKSLSPEWKSVFRLQMKDDTTASRENLHKLTETEIFSFKDSPVKDISAMSEFIRLKDFHFSGTSIVSITALDNIKGLKSLHATNSPLQDLESLSQFTNLESLDISNTPVDDLKPIGRLHFLKILNCSGTQIKKLDALEELTDLVSLDCSNTNVGKLQPVSDLPLKALKCYNTKISAKEVEKFKEKNKDCSVIYYR